MTTMPGRYPGERPGRHRAAQGTFLLYVVAVAVFMTGLLLHFGTLCTCDTDQDVAPAAHSSQIPAVGTSWIAYHAGQREQESQEDHCRCHRGPEYLVRVSPVHSLPAPGQVPTAGQRQLSPRSAPRLSAWAMQRGPPLNLLSCVFLI